MTAFYRMYQINIDKTYLNSRLQAQLMYHSRLSKNLKRSPKKKNQNPNTTMTTSKKKSKPIELKLLSIIKTRKLLIII